MRELWRKIRSAVRGLLGRCETCDNKIAQRHDHHCLFCRDARFCHRCAKSRFFMSMYGASAKMIEERLFKSIR